VAPDQDYEVNYLAQKFGISSAVARAAYEEEVKRRPGRIVTHRQKTRLLADSRRKN
jgi:hypothetical protein